MLLKQRACVITWHMLLFSALIGMTQSQAFVLNSMRVLKIIFLKSLPSFTLSRQVLTCTTLKHTIFSLQTFSLKTKNVFSFKCRSTKNSLLWASDCPLAENNQLSESSTVRSANYLQALNPRSQSETPLGVTWRAQERRVEALCSCENHGGMWRKTHNKNYISSR